VELELRDFVLGGVSLEGDAKERYNKIQQELAQLSTKFSNNVLDATKVCVCVYVCVCVCVCVGGGGMFEAMFRLIT
jgi:Zn-dependent oligopeptidase